MDGAALDALIESALAYSGGTHTLDDILLGIATDRYQLWTGEASVMVTEIVAYPQLRDLAIFLAAGAMDELRRMQHVVLAWGAEQGCRRATFTGRRGWERSPLVTEDGWTPTWTTCVRPLTPLTMEDVL